VSDERPTIFESLVASLRGTRPRDWVIALGFAIAAILPIGLVFYPLFTEVRAVYENGHYATLGFAFIGSVLVYEWYMKTVLRIDP